MIISFFFFFLNRTSLPPLLVKSSSKIFGSLPFAPGPDAAVADNLVVGRRVHAGQRAERRQQQGGRRHPMHPGSRHDSLLAWNAARLLRCVRAGGPGASFITTSRAEPPHSPHPSSSSAPSQAQHGRAVAPPHRVDTSIPSRSARDTLACSIDMLTDAFGDVVMMFQSIRGKGHGVPGGLRCLSYPLHGFHFFFFFFFLSVRVGLKIPPLNSAS